MAAPISLHHFGVCARNGELLLRQFTEKLTFRLFAKRETPVARQWAVKNGNAVFVITENRHLPCSPCLPNANGTKARTSTIEGICGDYSNLMNIPERANNVNSYFDNKIHSGVPHLSARIEPNSSIGYSDECAGSDTTNPHQQQQWNNSVFNVCFNVQSVKEIVNRVSKFSGKHSLLQLPTSLSDSDGVVEYAVVYTGIGNIIHTLIDTSKYYGVFLPCFLNIESNDLTHGSLPGQSLYFDHVTYACHAGSSHSIMTWYESCFGLKRFFINSDEDKDEGFTIKEEDFGLRLKAMEYWKCAETGLTNQNDSHESQANEIKIVFAEPLPGNAPNQVQQFLDHHGGPGIQHIGLHTNDIIETVSCMENLGVEFLNPPSTYYTEIGKLAEILFMGKNVEILRKHGILLDIEADGGDRQPTNDKNARYLMQVFTKPLFDSDTFFLEVIQRCGASGFGAGNITALWRSVQAFLRKSQA
ncbi:PREDICTED: 4-hydroxyphenylpyruvate dioxygenase-like protein [Priapulus caudatus]|uniref:4-hydroxyphenylpyruvate dioxygenase-like protein n=1 Tax=Priapulus caudatus TaxID=37621 RepID=A0ABM1F631_PRICU|nr:PREDICTED: 4-hydroxyphenylpyruvate dioxygenase-like protein [Priapulus caudatus]